MLSISFIVSIQIRIFPLHIGDIIIYVNRWWEKYLLKHSLIKHICSWHDKLIVLFGGLLNSWIPVNWTNYFIIKQSNKKCYIYFWPTCKLVKLKEGEVTSSTSSLMFHLIFFSPLTISFISSIIVYFIHI